MKKLIAGFTASAALLVLSAPAGAAPPGHPSGPGFGALTASIATSNPICLAYHVRTGKLDGPCAP
jgi:hypothetical protein